MNYPSNLHLFYSKKDHTAKSLRTLHWPNFCAGVMLINFAGGWKGAEAFRTQRAIKQCPYGREELAETERTLKVWDGRYVEDNDRRKAHAMAIVQSPGLKALYHFLTTNGYQVDSKSTWKQMNSIYVRLEKFLVDEKAGTHGSAPTIGIPYDAHENIVYYYGWDGLTRKEYLARVLSTISSTPYIIMGGRTMDFRTGFMKDLVEVNRKLAEENSGFRDADLDDQFTLEEAGDSFQNPNSGSRVQLRKLKAGHYRMSFNAKLYKQIGAS